MKQETSLDKANLLDMLSCAVLLLDTHLRIRYVNQSAEMMLGYSVRRALGRSIDSIIHTDLLQMHLEESVDSGQTHSVRESELQLNSGLRMTVDCTITPRFDNETITDIVLELNQIDRQVRIAREEELINQQSATQAIIRGLAHEIKNPLGGLRGAAQLLESELEANSLKEYTRIIISEADRLTNLVDRMLGPNQLPRSSMINIHEVTQHVRHLVAPSLAEGVVIKADYDPSIPEFLAVRDQIVQAVLNLVTNAIKAVNQQGEIILRTRILRHFTMKQINYRLVLKLDVMDNGMGVPSNLRHKLFYPMVSGTAEGSGLGLSIAQSLVNKNKGLIECRSRTGKTVFSVFIPLLDK